MNPPMLASKEIVKKKKKNFVNISITFKEKCTIWMEAFSCHYLQQLLQLNFSFI